MSRWSSLVSCDVGIIKRAPAAPDVMRISSFCRSELQPSESAATLMFVVEKGEVGDLR